MNRSKTRRWWGRGFLALAAAQVISAVGDRMSYVILPFVLYQLGMSVGAVAMVLAARGVGYGVTVLWGGALSDRANGRTVMVGSDLVRFVAQSILVALIFAGQPLLVAVLALQFIYGAAEGLFRPSARRMVPEVVPEGLLERANGYFSAASMAGFLIGPIIAAAFAAASLSQVALAVDALTFLISASLLVRLPQRTAPSSSGTRASVFVDMCAGLSVVWKTRWLRLVIVCSTIFHLTSLSAFYALGPAFADAKLGGASTWGVLVSVFGVGALLGGIFASRLRVRHPVVLLVGCMAIVAAQPLFITANIPLWGVAALQGAAGMSLSIYSVMQDSSEQRGIPREVLGRVTSVDLFLTTLAMPIGFLFAAQVSALVGVTSYLQISGAFAVLTCLVALILPSSRDIPSSQNTTGPRPPSDSHA